MEEWRYKSTHEFTAALDEWLALTLEVFAFRERIPGTD
jgi:hypothetical protein